MTTSQRRPSHWYDDGSGQQRRSEGENWGQWASQVAPAGSEGPRTMAFLAHILGIAFLNITAIAANWREWYRYPTSICLVPGARG